MRTLNATLETALANQQGTTILRVNTWTDAADYTANPSTPDHVWTCKKFEIGATTAEAELVTEENDYTIAAFTVFTIERGVKLSGVEYTIQSGLMHVRKYKEEYGKISITGSSYPNQKIIITAGDGTYQEVIEDFCTAIGKTAVFKDENEAWLGYQFLPTGKQVILNKAERFENLLRQKYLIEVYEESPNNLVFYNPQKPVSDWTDINGEGDQLVLVSSAGSHKAATSTNGTAWSKNSAPNFTNAVAYSPTLSLYVAVGNSVCQTSPDGITWTNRTIPAKNWNDVIWFEAISKFVAISTLGQIARSSDGITWADIETFTARTEAEANQWNSVCYSPSLSLFVAVSSNGTNRVMTSPDGVTWTARSAAEANQWHSVCWSPDLAIFCAVSLDGTNRAMTSTDGTTWTARAAPVGAWRSVCWSPALGLFVAVGDGGTYYAATSTDGTTWNGQTASAYSWYSVTWSPEAAIFVAVAYNGTNYAMTSTDGVTWTNRTLTASGWLSVCWSADLSLFCAVAYTGTTRVATSPDGITWTNRTQAASYEWRSVVYAPELSLFIAVASTTAINAAMTSTDGITWTSRATPVAAWYSVCWAAAISTVCAVAYSGTDQVMTSTNPDVSTPPTGSRFIAASFWDSVCVAIPPTGSTTSYTTTDGITWTARTFTSNTFYSVASNSNLYIAVGNSKCFTSPDGITWTERTIPTGVYYEVCWSEDLSLWLAVGNNVIATSPDGITWTARTSPAANLWVAATWSAELLLFIIASSDGENRIASSPNGTTWTILTTSADFSLDYLDGTLSYITHGLNSVHYIWRDEAETVNTLGDTDNPAWNLGYLESTAEAPTENTDPYYKFFLKAVPIRLDLTNGDRIHFSPPWTLDQSKTIDASIQITEIFDTNQKQVWYQEIRSLSQFENTEGGALPSTIERVAAYTPLVSSGFDGNLTPSVNNLQALAQAVDDLPLSLTTTERNAITNPRAGLTIYNSTTQKLNFYDATAATWRVVTST